MGCVWRIAGCCLCQFSQTQPRTNVISTGATDGLIVRCAVERSLYFVFVLVVVSRYAKAFTLGFPGGDAFLSPALPLWRAISIRQTLPGPGLLSPAAIRL